MSLILIDLMRRIGIGSGGSPRQSRMRRSRDGFIGPGRSRILGGGWIGGGGIRMLWMQGSFQGMRMPRSGVRLVMVILRGYT